MRPAALSATSLLVVALALVAPRVAFACERIRDCAAGSRCILYEGLTYGICLGGPNPGNENDVSPRVPPFDSYGLYGTPCTSDADCQPAGQCRRTQGRSDGVCVQKKAKPNEPPPSSGDRAVRSRRGVVQNDPLPPSRGHLKRNRPEDN